MAYRLPPLNSLRAFEVAARHMSFQKAAEELNVTPSALSYQVRQLEDFLQVPLFVRLNRAVRLTDAVFQKEQPSSRSGPFVISSSRKSPPNAAFWRISGKPSAAPEGRRADIVIPL